MSDMSLPPRRRPLWRLFIVPVLLLMAAAGWTAFWFYAASQVDASADAWRAQEAKSGRIYDCARRSVAGFPFRLEVRCDGASVSLNSQTAGQGAAQGPITAKLGEILVVAQIYDPKLLIAEFTAPATLSDKGGLASMSMTWSKAQSSVVGLPAVPQRASIVFDDRRAGSRQWIAADPGGAGQAYRTARAPRRRLDVGSAHHRNRAEDGNGQRARAASAACSSRSMRTSRTLLSGLNDFSPKPWPERFRELQAAGGHVEIVQSRIAQGDLVAVAAGTLALSAQRPSRGRIANDGGRHRENNSGARYRENAG